MRRTISVLGLLGRPAESRLLDLPAENLLRTRLVVPIDGGVVLRHALVGEIAVAELAEDDRRRLHSMLARRVPDPGEAARHFQAAGEEEAARAKALEAAASTTVPGERARHLRVAAVCASGREADDLRLRAARELVEAGEHAGAAALAQSIRTNDLAARAEVALVLGQGLSGLDRAAAEEHIDHGLELLQASGSWAPLEVELLIEKARLRSFSLDSKEMSRYAADALRLAEEHGVHVARARAQWAAVHHALGSPQSVKLLEAALEAAMHEGELRVETQVRFNLAAAYQAFGDPEASERVALETANRAAMLHLRQSELCATFVMVSVRLYAKGDYEEAIELTRRFSGDIAVMWLRDQIDRDLAIALADRGRVDEARELIERHMESLPTAGKEINLWHAISEIELAAGRPEVAIRASQRCATASQGHIYFSVMAALIEGWAAVDLERPWTAPELEGVLPHTAGAIPEMEGIGALTTGRGVDAWPLFEEASRLWAGHQFRSQVRCLWAAGEAARRAGNESCAREHLMNAEAMAERTGLVPLLKRIHRSLRQAGVRRHSPRSLAGDTVSGREAEVLALVRDGLTSPEIARRLGLSRSTVDDHVKSAMVRLGAKTRLEAADMVTRPRER